MPIKISYRVTSNRNLVKRGREYLRAEVPKIAKKRFKTAAEDLKKRVSKPGKKIKYPVNWDNRKQMIKVIIMLRKQKNLPYKRTNAHVLKWKVTAIKTGYTLTNSKKTSVYLFGDASGNGQSRIHQKRWVNLRRQADIVYNKLPKTIQREMVDLAKKVPAK